nr:Chain B, Peptide epitope (mutation N3A) [Homo sapiens]5YD5_D Chain D, Peptide epitope (mutation N3A) [Homo sapiens]
DIAYYTSEP